MLESSATLETVSIRSPASIATGALLMRARSKKRSRHLMGARDETRNSWLRLSLLKTSDSYVSMVQPAKDRMRNNVSEPLDRVRAGSVLPERNVSSQFVVIGGVLRKNSSKVPGV